MTALAGFWAYASSHPPQIMCERMLAAQQVYGPDRPAIWSAPDVAMGRRLFNLLPEDRYDRGPIVSPAGAGVLISDLRLDNRDELCGMLDVAAGEAATLPDAAILMRALERWGEGAVSLLLGPFAFAWWQPAAERLVLARDPFGERPLHFHRGEGFFAWASMAKGLHSLPDLPVAPNARTVAEFVALMPEMSGDSFFEDVQRVLPGHITTVTPGAVSTTRYWNPERRLLRLADPEAYEEALREQIDRAVKVRLRGSGGRVAAHLSAGLDSSTVAATAAQLLSPEGAVTAYTAIPAPDFQRGPERAAILDEGPLAHLVAEIYPNMEHVRLSAAVNSPFEHLDKYYFLFEQPILNLCNATWLFGILDDAKRRRHHVLLSGQMGNLTISFDGMTLLPQLLRQGRLVPLLRHAAALVKNGSRLGTVAAQTLGSYLPRSLWARIGRLRGKKTDLCEYTATHPARAADLEETARERAIDFVYRPRRDAFEQRVWTLGRFDPGNYNKGVLGGWGVDVRDPTLDRRLVEFCLSIPLEEYLRGGVPRSLIRRAMFGRLPTAILQERRKGYQAADWHIGMTAGRETLAGEIERLAKLDVACKTLDIARMQRLVREWPAGSWSSNAVTAEYRLALLRGTSAGHFLRKATGANT